MGRELRRKQAKKEGKTLNEKKVIVNNDPYSDIYKLLKTFGFILLIVLGIHFLTALIITKEIEIFSKNNEKEEEEVIIDGSILAKNIFMQQEEEYYVYFYDFDDANSSITSLLNSKLSTVKVYKVNTNDAFNSNYVTSDEVGNSGANSVENLKVINPTLIKIAGDAIVEYYETVDGITNYLESK